MPRTATMQPFGTAIPAYQAPFEARAAFIRRTYTHLTGAVLAFVALSAIIVEAGIGEAMIGWLSGSQFGWLMFLGAFAVVGWLGQSMAHGARSAGTQYAGLGIYTLAEALIFAPLIYIATRPEFAGALPTAAALTGLVFGGLSLYVHTTKKDFSFLGGALVAGGLVAIGLIVAGAIFGFSLGIWFCGAMILLAAGAILYDTSKILHHYGTDQHVAAALQLFASVALLFYYILMLLLRLQSRD